MALLVPEGSPDLLLHPLPVRITEGVTLEVVEREGEELSQPSWRPWWRVCWWGSGRRTGCTSV